MNKPLTADDVVVGILYVLHKGNPDLKITADRERLHRAFKMLVDSGCDALRKTFSFRQREFFAESSELDQALSNLDAAGLIARYNQTPKYYTVSDSLKVCFDDFSKPTLETEGITEDLLGREALRLAGQLEYAAA